jgi:hypothetical protein
MTRVALFILGFAYSLAVVTLAAPPSFTAAFAQTVATAPAPAVVAPLVIPYGKWAVMAIDVLFPYVLAAIGAGLTVLFGWLFTKWPWLADYISRPRVEEALTNSLDFAVNATKGEIKGGAITVENAPQVLRLAVSYFEREAPLHVIRAAGGADGAALKMFRKMHLAADAEAAAVLPPSALKLLEATKPKA